MLLKNEKNSVSFYLNKQKQGKLNKWCRISKGSNMNTAAYKFQLPVTQGSSLAAHNTEKHTNAFLNSKFLKRSLVI
jgi:hypothetical protein